MKVAHNDQALRGAIPAVRRSQSPRCGKRGVGPHRPRTFGMWRHTATRTCFQTSPAHNFEKLNSTPLGVQFPPFRVYSHRPAREYGPNDEAVASCSGACRNCYCPAQEHTATAAGALWVSMPQLLLLTYAGACCNRCWTAREHAAAAAMLPPGSGGFGGCCCS